MSWAVQDWLLYVTGGLAVGRESFSQSTAILAPFVENTSFATTRAGWTVGAGVEYAFAPQWSAKLEYNYMDFGTQAVSFAPGFSTDIDQQIHAVKFGINYKFGGNPIMARY